MLEHSSEVFGSDRAGQSQPLRRRTHPLAGCFASGGVVLLGAVSDHRGVVVTATGSELAETQQGDHKR